VNAFTVYNWKTKHEIQMLLKSTTDRPKMKCQCFYNLQLKNEKRNSSASTIYNWRMKNEMWMLLQSTTENENEIQILLKSTTDKRKMKCKCFSNLQLKNGK